MKFRRDRERVMGKLHFRAEQPFYRDFRMEPGPPQTARNAVRSINNSRAEIRSVEGDTCRVEEKSVDRRVITPRLPPPLDRRFGQPRPSERDVDERAANACAKSWPCAGVLEPLYRLMCDPV